jgi:hypothetical protein
VALTTTPTNPGAGGASVVTDNQSTGAQMPVSELAVSPDGIQDAVPVTGKSPLPVLDAATALLLQDIGVNMQALVDQMINGMTQVLARVAASPAGYPDQQNVLSVQGVVGGVDVSASSQGREIIGQPPAFKPSFQAIVGSDGNVRYPTFNPVAGGGFGGPTAYANVVTDLEGYRDDFNGTSLSQSLTGTCTFTNGSTTVTGVGTNFVSQLSTADTYVKLSTDPDSAYTKLLIQPFYANPTGGSNTTLTLAAPYPGSTGTGTGVFTFWADTIGAGGSIVEGSSQAQLSTGTTSGSYTSLQHGSHLIAPCNITVYAWASKAIANQEFAIGLVDSISAPGTQTLLVFNGTDATQVRLRTSSAGGLVETNAGTLPNGLLWTTPGAVRYRLVASEDAVVLYANDIPVVRNKLHLPAFYNPQPLTIAAYNTGAPASSSTLFVDVIGITSHDKVEVEMATTPQPAPTQISGYDALGNLQQPAVTAPGTGASPASPAVVVAVSPNTPVQTAPGSVMFDTAANRALVAIGAKLDAILWVLSQSTGQSPPSNDPAYVPMQ